MGTPDYKSNLYGEYRVPRVGDLSITGDWQFVGERPQDDENLHYTPKYQTFDLGFRYGHLIGSKLATLRFSANNLANVHYYSTGDITGTNASSNMAQMGAPRTIATSLQISF